MTFKFKRCNITNKEAYYETKDYFEIIKNEDLIYRILPQLVRTNFSSTGSYENKNLKFICDAIIDYKLECLRVNKNGEIVHKMNRSENKKIIELNHSLIELIENIDGAIKEHVRKNLISLEDDKFNVEFDEAIDYITMCKLDSDVVDYIDKNGNEPLIDVVKNTATKKQLERFYEELQLSIEWNSSEKELEKILKKYQNVLPLIIPSIDYVKEFQFIVEEGNLERNIIDAEAISKDNIPNLIELKKSDTELLVKNTKYRNNTYRPSIELTGAIQQANMQRINFILGATTAKEVIIKSILIIGNKKEEFEEYGDIKEALYDNFNTIRYNNKDTEIITYDELLDRIKNVIEKISKI